MIPPLPTMAISSGNASGTTRSAVGNGTITVRDTSQQTQDVGTLSRNTDDANGHIDKIFDKDKIQTDQQVTQLAEQVMQQTASNVLNQLSVNAKDDAAKKLSSDAAYQAADAGQRKSMEDAAFLAVDQKYGIGSPYWTAATAISGALAGLTGGDMSQALAGGLAPYLSLAVKAATTDDKNNVNEVENITGHALAGAVVAYLQGGSVSGGAAGAATGELAAQLIAKELYPGVKPENLTNEQKANVSALSTLAAGLAGGVAGNSSLAAGTGAVAGKTAVENNAVGCSARTCPTSLGDDIMHGGGMGGGTTGGAAGAGIGAIIAGMFGDDEKHDQPNVGKDLTDADKAELGGTGSGTPGGWGPEDEENARNQESTSSGSGKSAETIGRDIADGHAFEKHVLEQNEYADLGIKTKEQFAQHIENVVKNPTSTKELSNGRSAYWDQSSGTVVIRNPKAADGGTAFRPTNGRAYFDNLR